MEKYHKIDNSKIPEYVTRVTETLEKAGFEAFLVGGCVRDLILEREPKDWDITTNAKPEEIMPLFEKTVYENTYGTVGVCLPFQISDPIPAEKEKSGVTHETSPIPEIGEEGDLNLKEPKYNIIEVTPYRIEAKYDDFRHPSKVKFSEKIEDDLKRRDFTINAMAYSVSKRHLIDLYKGQEDIKDMVIKTVGEAQERFNEDALRMLRAIRFSSQLNFTVSYETMEAITKNAHLMKNISEERIRDEFVKIINSSNGTSGVVILSKLGLLKYIVPELEEGIGCEQGGAHIFDVFEHSLHALDHSIKKNLPLEIRLASLFHDIGKPRSRRKGIRKSFTFYGHEVIGSRMTKTIMERLRFPKKMIDFVTSMVRNHMFFADTEQISLSAVRRMIQKVGQDNIWKLMQIREADRVGMKKKEAPYRLRKYHAMIEEVLRDPISVSQLKINGETLIKELGMKPGPRMGWILNALLEKILDNPEKNTKEQLIDLVKSLDKLDDKELKKLGEKGKEKKENLDSKEVEKLHAKHGIKK
ncbi:MAG: HD domain-containing protein [Candidatus Pacebacteria bacterium]|nr:HD domain-containing protein [Candidatus Paceibacterota bacterium]